MKKDEIKFCILLFLKENHPNGFGKEKVCHFWIWAKEKVAQSDIDEAFQELKIQEFILSDKKRYFVTKEGYEYFLRLEKEFRKWWLYAIKLFVDKVFRIFRENYLYIGVILILLLSLFNVINFIDVINKGILYRIPWVSLDTLSEIKYFIESVPVQNKYSNAHSELLTLLQETRSGENNFENFSHSKWDKDSNETFILKQDERIYFTDDKKQIAYYSGWFLKEVLDCTILSEDHSCLKSDRVNMTLYQDADNWYNEVHLTSHTSGANPLFSLENNNAWYAFREFSLDRNGNPKTIELYTKVNKQDGMQNVIHSWYSIITDFFKNRFTLQFVLKPFENYTECSKYEFSFDQDNNETEARCYWSNWALRENVNGWAIRRRWIEKKSIEKNILTDEDEEYTKVGTNFLSKDWKLINASEDEWHYAMKLQWFDPSVSDPRIKDPKLEHGYYESTEINKVGITKERFFWIDNFSVELSDDTFKTKHSGKSYKTDEKWNRKTIVFLDKNGWATQSDWIVRVDFDYDGDGNVIQESYLDKHDHIALDEYGEGIIKRQFDNQGNKTEELYFGVDWEAVNNVYGVHKIVWQYGYYDNSDQKKFKKAIYYSKDDIKHPMKSGLKENKNAYSISWTEFNEKGRVTSEWLFWDNWLPREINGYAYDDDKDGLKSDLVCDSLLKKDAQFWKAELNIIDFTWSLSAWCK